MICAVPGCSRPATSTLWGVCSAHRREELAPAVLMEEYENCLTDEDLERAQPIKIAAVPLRWQPLGGTPYGRAVLAGQLQKLALCEPGARNQSLNRAAFLLGGYVAGGELEMDVVARGLALAAEVIGLRAREALATIRSGLKEGFRKPVSAPAR